MAGMKASIAMKCSDQTPHPNTPAASGSHGQADPCRVRCGRARRFTVVKLAMAQMHAASATNRGS